MLLLSEVQNNFIQTIKDGPDALDPSIFAGPIDRILLGLKAHAITINHARLVALEETFPKTRAAMGDTVFNKISRDYCETAMACAAGQNAIGRHFPEFLIGQSVIQNISDLAAIEWTWLESYHAPDAMPLVLADIAGMSEPDLIALEVAAHPAANCLILNAPLHPNMAELKVIEAAPYAILTVRPEADVLLVPIDKSTADTFAKAKNTSTIGNLFANLSEQGCEADPLAAVMTLLQAGALTLKIALK
jgi:hypothetical protein